MIHGTGRGLGLRVAASKSAHSRGPRLRLAYLSYQYRDGQPGAREERPVRDT